MGHAHLDSAVAGTLDDGTSRDVEREVDCGTSTSLILVVLGNRCRLDLRRRSSEHAAPPRHHERLLPRRTPRRSRDGRSFFDPRANPRGSGIRLLHHARRKAHSGDRAGQCWYLRSISRNRVSFRGARIRVCRERTVARDGVDLVGCTHGVRDCRTSPGSPSCPPDDLQIFVAASVVYLRAILKSIAEVRSHQSSLKTGKLASLSGAVRGLIFSSIVSAVVAIAHFGACCAS